MTYLMLQKLSENFLSVEGSAWFGSELNRRPVCMKRGHVIRHGNLVAGQSPLVDCEKFL